MVWSTLIEVDNQLVQDALVMLDLAGDLPALLDQAGEGVGAFYGSTLISLGFCHRSDLPVPNRKNSDGPPALAASRGRVYLLPNAAREAWLPVGGERRHPVPRIRHRPSVHTGVAIGMLDRLLHRGCLVTVGGDSSCPFAESVGPVPLTDRPGSPTDRRSAWRVENLNQTSVAA
jgi:hypothetical protein